MDQNQIALPGIEHLPMDDGLVADAADMSVLEESIQMMRTRQRLSAEPSHIFFFEDFNFSSWLVVACSSDPGAKLDQVFSKRPWRVAT